jgi:hypothetical protein
MTPSQESTNLLETLKQLYSRIMGLHAEARARSSLNRGNTGSSQDIVSPLSITIDKLAARALYNPAVTPNSQNPELENHPHDHASISRESSSRTELGDLSVHLKNSHRYSGVSLNTGDKLMQSTWEHFHAAIRLARQGDVDAARLHVELTNNALKEAAHYLSEPVYSRFSKDVIKALEDINGQI